MTMLTTIAPMEQRGAFMAANGLLLRLAQTVAPIFMGMIYALFGMDAVFYTGLLCSIAILAMALGMTWGIGTVLLVFYNGAILGAVLLDYIQAGQSLFLTGWLLPHGSVEIPAFLVAGQGGLVLAKALIGHGDRTPTGQRLRKILPDLTVLISGVAVMLIWAGLIESFFSQYHAPVLPYSLKISFGLIELLLLVLYLGLVGKRQAS